MSEETKLKKRLKVGRKIAQFTVNGEFIRTFDSIMEANRETGCENIRFCINKDQRTAGGYFGWIIKNALI